MASIGLYGVLSYGVTRRTRELGIRIAIGATRQSILWLIFREAGGVLGVGIVVGLGAAWALGRVVRTLLFGIGPADPVSVAAAWSFWLPRARSPPGFRPDARPGWIPFVRCGTSNSHPSSAWHDGQNTPVEVCADVHVGPG